MHRGACRSTPAAGSYGQHACDVVSTMPECRSFAGTTWFARGQSPCHTSVGWLARGHARHPRNMLLDGLKHAQHRCQPSCAAALSAHQKCLCTSHIVAQTHQQPDCSTLTKSQPPATCVAAVVQMAMPAAACAPQQSPALPRASLWCSAARLRPARRGDAHFRHITRTCPPRMPHCQTSSLTHTPQRLAQTSRFMFSAIACLML